MTALAPERTAHRQAPAGPSAAHRRLAKLAGRVAVGLVLVLAAVLKSRHLGGINLAEHDLLSSRVFWDAVAWAELAVGLWLVSDVYARAAVVTADVCFAVYFQFSLYFAAVGQTTCPCFGSVEVASPLMAVFDFLALFILLNCVPPRSGSATWHTHPRRVVSLVGLLLTLGLSSTATIHRYRADAIDYTLRNDPVLGARVVLDGDSLTPGVVLDRLSHATGGVPFRLDPELGDRGQKLGEVHLPAVNAWALMEWLAGEQSQPADWVRRDGGFLLRRVPAWMRLAPGSLLVVNVLAITLALWWGAREAGRAGPRAVVAGGTPVRLSGVR